MVEPSGTWVHPSFGTWAITVPKLPDGVVGGAEPPHPGDTTVRKTPSARRPCLVMLLQVHRVHPDGRPALEPIGLGLQLEHSPGADVGAHPAADAAGALHVDVGHGVLADVDAHLAVGGAVPAGDAHVLLHRDAEPPELLDEAEERRHGAAEAARSEERR